MGIPFCTGPVWAPKEINPMNKFERETVKLVALAAGSIFLSSLACGLAILTGLPLIPCLGVVGLIMMVICCLAVVKIYKDGRGAMESLRASESAASLLDDREWVPFFLPSNMTPSAMHRSLVNNSWGFDVPISDPVLAVQSFEWYDRQAHSCPFQ